MPLNLCKSQFLHLQMGLVRTLGLLQGLNKVQLCKEGIAHHLVLGKHPVMLLPIMVGEHSLGVTRHGSTLELELGSPGTGERGSVTREGGHKKGGRLIIKG